MDSFKLTSFRSMPIKINQHYYQIKNLEENIALGKVLRNSVDLNKCINYGDNYFCDINSEFRKHNETKTCIGCILHNSEELFKTCNFEKVENFKDKFIYLNGEYFFSLNGSLSLELLCNDRFGDGQIVLKGTGRVKIKKFCYAKHKDILLIGSHSLNLNKTYEICYHQSPVSNDTFAILNSNLINNITMHKLNEITSPSNHFEVNNNNKTHFMSIYSILLIILICIIVIVIKKYRNRILGRADNKVDKTDSIASTSSFSKSENTIIEDNNIQSEALAAAKQAKVKKTGST